MVQHSEGRLLVLINNTIPGWKDLAMTIQLLFTKTIENLMVIKNGHCPAVIVPHGVTL
jgi:hypothetical protein